MFYKLVWFFDAAIAATVMARGDKLLLLDSDLDRLVDRIQLLRPSALSAEGGGLRGRVDKDEHSLRRAPINSIVNGLATWIHSRTGTGGNGD